MRIVFVLLILLCWTVTSLLAALTPEHRKELTSIRKEVGKVTNLINTKKFDDAQKVLDESEERVKKIISDAMVPETDKAIAPVLKLIKTKRTSLEKKRGNGAGGLSFSKDVASILLNRCSSCHTESRRAGGLVLDTFTGIETGGDSGGVVVPGNSAQSELISRLSAQGNQRMPRGQDPLPQTEIDTLTKWINQGAKFDGTNKTAKITATAGNTRTDNKTEPATAVIAKPTGNETVSFKNDIAPFVVNLCSGCHGGNNPRSGFSVATFESLMKGGTSGRVVIGGNLEGSRLWKLVGGLEAPRMPQGQARITRANYNNLKTWIEEGAVFDGDDAKAPLRDLVPTTTETKKDELAKLSPEEFAKLRLERSHEQWKRAHPKVEPRFAESEEVIVYGDVSEERLKVVAEWADTQIDSLRKMFSVKDTPLFRGKLTIFLFKDRFGYEEFPLVIDMQEVPRETLGHSRVTAEYEDAYICLEDVGDSATEESPGLKLNLIDHLTGAFVRRSGNPMPDWMIRGLGLALASREDKKNEYILSLRGSAIELTRGITDSSSVMANGTFSSSDVAPIGLTLVEYMLGAGGAAKFGQLLDKLQKGELLPAALATVYNADSGAIGAGYLRSLGSAKPPKKNR